MATKKKINTKKAVKKEAPKVVVEPKYSRVELAEIFGISAYDMRTYFSLAGVSFDTKLTITEARRLFDKI